MKILIIDDEVYSVEAIVQNLDWDSLGIKEVHRAYSMRQAQEMIRNNRLDILICDIEMPKGSGIDLLTWVRAEGYALECIFLTSFPKFEYASQAIKLQIYDYLLKPIGFEALSSTIRRLTEKIKKDRDTENKSLYGEYWSDEKARIISELWNHVLDESISSSKENIEHNLKIRHMDQNKAGLSYYVAVVKPVPTDDLLVWDKELFQVAFSNVTQESLDTETIIYRDQNFVTVILNSEKYSGAKALVKELYAYLAALESVFSAPFQVYFDKAGHMGEVFTVYRYLVKDCKGILSTNRYVYRHGAPYIVKELALALSTEKKEAWQNTLVRGDYRLIFKDISEYLKLSNPNEVILITTLFKIYHMVMNVVYECFDMTLAKSKETIQEKSTLSEDCYDSIPRFLDAIYGILKAASKILNTSKSSKTSIHQIKKYILDHLKNDLNRTVIAEEVHLNQDYLSFLFKEKTGLTIKEYINSERIKYAKKLLLSTALPINEVAIESGFQNVSYFSETFKKYEETTPLKFRKENQNFRLDSKAKPY